MPEKLWAPSASFRLKANRSKLFNQAGVKFCQKILFGGIFSTIN